MPEVVARFSPNFFTNPQDRTALTLEIRDRLAPAFAKLAYAKEAEIVADWQGMNIVDGRFDLEVEVIATVSEVLISDLPKLRKTCMIQIAKVLLKRRLITRERLLNKKPEVTFSVFPRLTQGGFSDASTFEWSDLIGLLD